MVHKKFKEFLGSAKRIFLIAKKPTGKEFSVMAKIVGLGMVIIGIIGYLIRLIINLISGSI